MALLDGLTKNQAELRPGDSDDDLRPLALSLAPVHAVTWAQRIIAGWPRWKIEAVYEDRAMIHATHTTRVFRFVDDVHIIFEPDSRGSLLMARSQSRIGKGDLGQNARNLRALVRGLQNEDQIRRARLADGVKINT
ncbi:DUF1499 domain-containing protein [Tautonia rosea]|uniref:DUF1499 domain-containing protein n=1 Tax=Tautonia rosea TaxID=2728037 RepID=UPI00147467CE|nr:DUF1499 domain-containing protein [Tautonia rosea]